MKYLAEDRAANASAGIDRGHGWQQPRPLPPQPMSWMGRLRLLPMVKIVSGTIVMVKAAVFGQQRTAWGHGSIQFKLAKNGHFWESKLGFQKCPVLFAGKHPMFKTFQTMKEQSITMANRWYTLGILSAQITSINLVH